MINIFSAGLPVFDFVESSPLGRFRLRAWAGGATAEYTGIRARTKPWVLLGVWENLVNHRWSLLRGAGTKVLLGVH